MHDEYACEGGYNFSSTELSLIRKNFSKWKERYNVSEKVKMKAYGGTDRIT